MKIQVFGPKGMLGSAVVKAVLRRGHELSPHAADLEVVSPAHIDGEVVINCAGLVKQRQYAPSRFMVVNAVGPHRLAEACDKVGARLIHVSTDCVFQGPGPHSEESTPDATDHYARSKLAGEVTRAPHMTVRTSFIGYSYRGLLYDVQHQANIRASDKLLWSGHTVDTVADALVTLAEHSDLSGLLHIPGEFRSRLDLVWALKMHLDLAINIIVDNAFVADRRLKTHYWYRYELPELPSFAAQLEAMERP